MVQKCARHNNNDKGGRKLVSWVGGGLGIKAANDVIIFINHIIQTTL